MLVKVKNQNRYPFKGLYKGSMINIDANSHISMDYDEAVQFLGTYHAPVYDKHGQQKPESYKWLIIEEGDLVKALKDKIADKDQVEKTKFVCHACEKEFNTKNGLLAHIKKQHSDIMADSDARDELLDNEDI